MLALCTIRIDLIRARAIDHSVLFCKVVNLRFYYLVLKSQDLIEAMMVVVTRVLMSLLEHLKKTLGEMHKLSTSKSRQELTQKEGLGSLTEIGM